MISEISFCFITPSIFFPFQVHFEKLIQHEPFPRDNFSGTDVELVTAHAQALVDVFFMDYTERFRTQFGVEYIARYEAREALEEDKARWVKGKSQELVIEKMKYSVRNQLFGIAKEFSTGLGIGLGGAVGTAAVG